MEEYVLFSCDTKFCIPSIYLDPSIFDWFTMILKNNNFIEFVKDVWNITIKDVNFRDLNVKLIQFIGKDDFVEGEMYIKLKAFIKEMLVEAKFCLPWLPGKNLYCAQEDYNDRVVDLKLNGGWNSVTTISDYYPNWIEQKKLKLIKFKQDTIFSYKEMLNKYLNRIKVPLYISCAYPWHQPWNINYFKYPTDFLAIDICASEWKRSNALDDFNIFDILSLDLAVCDANDYLNSYIEKLFSREFKHIKNLHGTNKFEHFDLECYLAEKKRNGYVHIDIYLYFIYSYGELLKTINWANHNIQYWLESDVYFFMIIKTIFPNIDIQNNKYLKLDSYKLAPEQILTDIQRSKYGNMILNISNYKHFSFDMLNDLLKIGQVIRIEINIDILENFDVIPAGRVGRIINHKTIYFYSDTGGNVQNIENILKYLSKFHAKDLSALLSITIKNCVIDNYEIFNKLDLYSFAFQNTEISLIDLRIFCNHQQNLKSLYFIDCIQFGDHHLIQLLEDNHLKIKRLSVEGLHSVTINFYFMYAEHQLRTKELIKFKISGLFPIINLKSIEIFKNLTFVLNQRDNVIDVYNDFNEVIDIYDLFYSSDINDRDTYEFYM